MVSSLRGEFEDYARFSMRVDRFFNAVKIYGSHHYALKSMHNKIPPHEVMERALGDEGIDQEIRDFCVLTIYGLSNMGATGIFSNREDLVSEEVPEDLHNFAFYVCFCFQWNLFEAFTRKMVTHAIDAGALPPDACGELRKNRRNTKQFLDCLNSGRVFGHSPFVTVLPVVGWVSSLENCGYTDLDEIRDLRNDLVHGATSPKITGSDGFAKEKLYSRSMRILREFASNVQQDAEQAIRRIQT